MTRQATIVPLQVEVRRAEVERVLGYRRAAEPRERVALRLGEIWPEAVSLLDPRGAFRIVEGSEAAAAGVPEPGERVGIGVCTIGAALEEEAARRGEDGDLLGALLLDTVGSAAAEAAADALNRRLCEAAGALGLQAARRVSPGYGDWDVASQRELLGLLPIGELGISLTTGRMMVPRKSVSFAASLRPAGEPSGGEREGCSACPQDDCPYRAEGGR